MEDSTLQTTAYNPSVAGGIWEKSRPDWQRDKDIPRQEKAIGRKDPEQK